MSSNSDHSRLIAKAAKEALLPLGCRQKGRSRLWCDDQQWWVGVIEFQPSAWGSGSYLNVGAMWLWHAKDHYSFDEGYRVEDFSEFKNEGQFSEAAMELAKRAAAEVASLRMRFSSVHAVAIHLAQKKEKSIWDHYHTTNALAVDGEPEAAQAEISAVLAQKEHAPWVTEVKAKAKALSRALISPSGARNAILEEVANARSLLGLPVLACFSV